MHCLLRDFSLLRGRREFSPIISFIGRVTFFFFFLISRMSSQTDGLSDFSKFGQSRAHCESRKIKFPRVESTCADFREILRVSEEFALARVPRVDEKAWNRSENCPITFGRRKTRLQGDVKSGGLYCSTRSHRVNGAGSEVSASFVPVTRKRVDYLIRASIMRADS